MKSRTPSAACWGSAGSRPQPAPPRAAPASRSSSATTPGCCSGTAPAARSRPLAARPSNLIVTWLDKILRNTIGAEQKAESRKQKSESTAGDSGFLLSAFPISAFSPESVEIDGVTFAPGQLKGASLAVGGGAQFGKTVLELNLMAYATAVRFLSVGNYLPDRPKVEEIVGQKFRPNVLDLYPWMAEMIQLGKIENASGKTINRKESYTVTDGERKSFGSFCGMHKPPTSITLDLALLDEVDDIPDRNIGYVDARMTSSPVHLTCFIGTQRVAGAGQNARLKASSFHVKMVPCPACGREWCLEEEFPRCVRVASPRINGLVDKWIDAGSASPSINPPIHQSINPILSPEAGHDRLARYYVACPECGTELDRDAGRYVPKHPERIAQARLGVRVSQLNISAISMQEIVGAWYAAFEDPSGNALAAFYCDRIAIPNAGAAQPITSAVLDDARRLGLGDTEETAAPYAMSLASEIRNPKSEIRRASDADAVPVSDFGASGPPPSVAELLRRTGRISQRVAGMDMGPRCWFWCDEIGNSISQRAGMGRTHRQRKRPRPRSHPHAGPGHPLPLAGCRRRARSDQTPGARPQWARRTTSRRWSRKTTCSGCASTTSVEQASCLLAPPSRGTASAPSGAASARPPSSSWPAKPRASSKPSASPPKAASTRSSSATAPKASRRPSMTSSRQRKASSR